MTGFLGSSEEEGGEMVEERPAESMPEPPQEMEQSDWIGAIEDCREYCDLRPDAYHGPVNYDGRH